MMTETNLPRGDESSTCEKIPKTMSGWFVNSYEENQIQFSSSLPTPQIGNPKQVLVKVQAAGVNPIDTLMLKGYGHVVLNYLRKKADREFISEIPLMLILGREFVGLIVDKGNNVESVNIGDIVMGTTMLFKQGCHAQYALADETDVIKKPNNLSIEEAASLLYGGITALSALKLTKDSAKDKRILILGGSGSVGSVSIQLLKMWQSFIIATCSTNAIRLVEKFGADVVLDYTDASFEAKLKENGPYDIILDARSGSNNCQPYVSNLRKFSFSRFISLRSSALLNTDSYGLILGSVKSALDLIWLNIRNKAVFTTASIRWGFFSPSYDAIKLFVDAAAENKIKAVCEKSYNLNEADKAYERVTQGHLRGKIVILMDT